MKNITEQIIANSTGWDEAGDYGDVQLYNGILQVDTAKFKKGDKISTATFLFTQSILQLWNKEGSGLVEEIPLKLSLDLNK
jgi:hypothetical protein